MCPKITRNFFKSLEFLLIIHALLSTLVGMPCFYLPEISWHPQHVIALTTTLLQPIYTPAAWMTVNQYRQCHILAASLLSSHETGHVWKSPSMLWIWMGFSSTVGNCSMCALCVLRSLNKCEVKTSAREKGIICCHKILRAHRYNKLKELTGFADLCLQNKIRMMIFKEPY